MKKIQKNILLTVIFAFIACSMIACKKNGYLTDGGLEKAYTPFSTYDYLKNNKYHQFDTVLMVIDHFNLKDSVNNSKTFFAFTDMSLHILMQKLQVTSLSQLTDSVSSHLFTQYMFNQTITLDKASLTPLAYVNEAGAAAPCAISKTAATEIVYGVATPTTYTYYILNYVKVNGLVDGVNGPVPGDDVDLTLPCQTTGIQTSSGTTLHVLANNVLLNKL